MTAPMTDKSSRLAINKAGGKMVADYWERIFTARERGEKVVWYNGSAVNPIFQAAGMAWCHGEAFSARLAAQHLEGRTRHLAFNPQPCSRSSHGQREMGGRQVHQGTNVFKPDARGA